MTLSPEEQEDMEEYYREQAELAKQEALSDNPVHQECGYTSFVSRSKGRNKRGQMVLRKHPKEVELFRYNHGWHLPHNFPFDEHSCELLGYDGSEELADLMRHISPRDGGRGITNNWEFRLAIRKGMNRVRGYRFNKI